MARRTRTTESNKQAEATEAADTQAKEANVSTVTEEAPAAAEAANESTTTEQPAPAAAEIDLTAFKEAVAAAVAEKDSSTGVVPEVHVEPVVREYRNIDGLKGKNQARAFLKESMKDSMNSLDIQTARAYLQIEESLSSSGGAARTEKAPADPTEAFVQRYAALRLALGLVADNVPEGVSDDWQEKAKAAVEEGKESAATLFEWQSTPADERGDEEPDGSTLVKAAVKLATARGVRSGSGTRSTYTGERRDIGKHIEEAFADKEAGEFLTIAQIRAFNSSEYGSNPPSAGAISARLFPTSGKTTVEGVEPGTKDNRKGATKL